MNLGMLLDMVADGLGDRVAIGSRNGGTTYAEIRQMAKAAASTLAGSPSHTLALVDQNGPVVPVTLFAAAWSGMSYAPLNYRLPPTALRELLDRLGDTVVVYGKEHHDVLTGAHEITVNESTGWLDGLRQIDADVEYPSDPTRPAVLLFTSGTSAAPKAAVLDHDNLLAYLLNTVEFASADEDDAVLLSVPPFHIAGVAGVLSSIYAGRRIVPLPRFTPEDWLRTARDEGVTHAMVVPTMLDRIVAAMEADDSLRVPTLRNLSYGGARMPVPVLERALELFPDAGFVNAYGLTETSSTVALLGPEDHRLALSSDDPAVRDRLASVGKPLPSIEVSVVDEDGKVLGPGEVGRLRIAGPQVAGSYLDDSPNAVDDGWLVTGDLGYVDAEGYLFIKGRADDVIIKGGENISPSEIEDALLRHPDVTAAAVVGVPDEEWGERVGAMITTRAGASLTIPDLTAWVKERIGTLKTPEIIEVREELPMTPTGKILRRVVREELGGPSPA